jgi:prepilin-type N-terminal cleavage/methylation domain-containing protein
MSMGMRALSKLNRAARRTSEGGFSLLELMIGLTILAIALVPVAYFYTKSLQTVEKASIRTRALMLARERITEVRQMPYDQIRTNVTPSREQLKLYAAAGTVDPDAEDWYGYDFELQPPAGRPQWKAMFNFPLPLDYNPYQPATQGYNNADNVNHYVPANPVNGMTDPHVNFNNGGLNLDYEYEPIGFYEQKVYNRNQLLIGNRDVGSSGDLLLDSSDIRMADRRTLSLIEPSLDGGNDYFRMGNDQQVRNYAVFGRRTIIMDVIPDPLDTDPFIGGDNFAPDDDRDGGATAINPYPLSKGPDNKFQVVSEYGTRGKLVTVQVFWMPRNADDGYVAWEDMDKIELKTFIPAGNEGSNLPTGSGSLGRTDHLFITPPN